MKRWLFIVVALAVMLSMFSSVAFAGNNAPSGAHFNLNIIGVSKGKTADMDGNNGNRIFVWLNNSGDMVSKIWLTMGSTFNVLDANGTDSDGARFMLPAADLDNDGITTWSVYARPLGRPGGSASMYTCGVYTDVDPDEELCSVMDFRYNTTREKGPSKFENVTRYLAYVYADIDGDGDIDRVPIFSDEFDEYYWAYDNSGLKLLQLRFYEIATNVGAPPPQNP